jgi:hypothetical protein
MRRLAGTSVCAALVSLLVVPAIANASVAHGSGSHEANEAGRWALAIALAFLVIGVPLIAWIVRWGFWLLTRKRPGVEQPKLWWGRSLVVGQDNRVSTSKTAALVWTYTLAASLLSFLIARWLGHPHGYELLSKEGLNAQDAVLIGGPLGAAILAKGIVSAQVDSGSSAKPPADSASPAQLVQGDGGETDLGDVQYLLFNIVALAFFYGEMFRVPQAGLPTIPDVLVGLTSVSAVGFVGKKALAGPAVISEVRPPAATVDGDFTLVTSGIVKSEEDLPAVTVAFGEAAADRRGLTVTTTTTLGVLIEGKVPQKAAGKVAVKVSVPTGKQAVWEGFEVIPEISPGQLLRGHPNEAIRVMTTGVVGLGKGLPGLKVAIGDKAAQAALSADEQLVVTVPGDAPVGETQLTLSTPGGMAGTHQIEILA